MKYMILTYASQRDYDAMAGKAGEQPTWSGEDVAAIGEGTAGPRVARLPESDDFIPRRILSCRANQFVAVPASPARMQRSGKRGESSKKTRSGLTGSAVTMARSSISFHHAWTFDSIFSRHE